MIGIPIRPPIVPVVEIMVNKRPEKEASTFDARKERSVTVALEPKATTAVPAASVAMLGANEMRKEPVAESITPSEDRVRSLAGTSSFRLFVNQELPKGTRTKYKNNDTSARSDNNKPACVHIRKCCGRNKERKLEGGRREE